ncbi:hypothetical protein ACFE04_015414 [Oxalis oulophora]
MNYRHNRRTSSGAVGGGGNSSHSSHEELPMISFSNHESDHEHDHPITTINPIPSASSNNLRRQFDEEVIVKVDAHHHDNDKDDNDDDYSSDNEKDISHHRINEITYEAQPNVGEPSTAYRHGRDPSFSMSDQPPAATRISQIMDKQRNALRSSNNDITLDIDGEMDELNQAKMGSSKEIRVSFEPSLESGNNVDNSRIYYKNSADDGDEVVRCSANASFDRSSQRRSNILSRLKTNKSRLMDPPPQPEEVIAPERKSGMFGKSGPIPRQSGMLMGDDDEEDPFSVDDLPDKYRKAKLSAIILIEWLSLFLIVSVLIVSLAIPGWKHKTLWTLSLWKWEVFVLALICGRLVSGWGIRIIVFFIERNFFMRKRVLYFVYGLRKAVQNCLWLGLVLVTWHLLLYREVEKETNSGTLLYVTKVLICFLLGTLLWLVKTLIIKVLASSFHVSTYFDRIQESLFNQYVIETLSGPPLIEIQKNEEEEEKMAVEISKWQNAGYEMPADLRAAIAPGKSSRIIGSGGNTFPAKGSGRRSSVLSGPLSKKQTDDDSITIDHLHKLNHKNVSAWNMKRLINMVRHCSLSTLDEQILDSTYEDDAKQIRSEYEAKAAAKKIFQNVAHPGAKYIYLEDFMRFLREEESLKAMSLFEGATERRKISKSSLKNWVVNAFRERRALALTLNDTKTAVKKLHNVVNIIVSIAILVIWLVVLNIATSKFLLFVSSQLVLVAFIFGNTCKTIFESIIFLFVIHPFDVGDRCEIDGVQMVVEEMNILTTVFLRYDNLKLVFPNSILSQRYICNFYRSPDMGDAIEFLVHIATPTEKIAMMRQRIISYIESKQEHWYEAPMVILRDMDELNRIKIAVWLQHKMNHQDMGEKFIRRAALLDKVIEIVKELDIQYRLLPLDINVKAMPPFPMSPNTTNTQLPPLWSAPSSL